MDMGMRVWTLAKALTPGQLAEMLAIKKTALEVARSPILASHYHSDEYGPLIRRRLLSWSPPPVPFQKSKWRTPGLTKLGERVMLCRIGWDLAAAGALPPEPEFEPE